MNYKVNQSLELPVRRLGVDGHSDSKYAVVDDGEKEYRIYNILKSQIATPPKTMHVVVKYITTNGYKLQQDELRLFKQHYSIGKCYRFDVVEVKQDYGSDSPYYVLEDDFAQHFYYFKGEQKYQIDDECILKVNGFSSKTNNILQLTEVNNPQDAAVETAADDEDDNNQNVYNTWNNLPVLNVGDESETLEFKTSIVFTPNGVADIDAQLFNVIKELTAFMNTNGGALYIGIHDKTKKVIGIGGDMQHLNDGQDEFNGQYDASNDKYELKIRHKIDKLCPSIANSLIKFNFESLGGRTYCKIDVKPAHRPIFEAKTQLFVRQGNRCKRLEGDEITFFITEKMTLRIHDIIDVDGLTMKSSMQEEQLREVLRKIINERKVSNIAPPPPSGQEIDYWMVWNDDCTWLRQRDKAEGDVLQVPVYKSMSDPLVVFCYDNNHINVVKLSDFRKKVNLNKPQNNAWNEDNGKPKSIFVAETSSLVVIHSIDYNDIEYVKLHALTDFRPTAAAKNAGAPILPDGVKVLSYSIIGAEHRGNLQGLIVPKAKRSNEKGTPVTSPAFANEIDYLKKL